jgi:hypothetical protein
MTGIFFCPRPGTAVAVAVTVTHNASPKRGCRVAVGHEFELGCVVPMSCEVAGGFSIPFVGIHWRYTYPMIDPWMTAERSAYRAQSLEPPQHRN